MTIHASNTGEMLAMAAIVNAKVDQIKFQKAPASRVQSMVGIMLDSIESNTARQEIMETIKQFAEGFEVQRLNMRPIFRKSDLEEPLSFQVYEVIFKGLVSEESVQWVIKVIELTMVELLLRRSAETCELFEELTVNDYEQA